jgi:hypothetical protein
MGKITTIEENAFKMCELRNIEADEEFNKCVADDIYKNTKDWNPELAKAAYDFHIIGSIDALQYSPEQSELYCNKFDAFYSYLKATGNINKPEYKRMLNINAGYCPNIEKYTNTCILCD